MKLSKLAAGAAIVSSLAVTALAHGGATGIVKERMDGMGVMKQSMKVLTPMMQGKTPYDASVIRNEAEKIGGHAGEALTKLFPEGTHGKPSEARPEIWNDWDGFAGLAEQLRAVSEGLVLAADNGMMTTDAGQGTSLMGGSMMGSGMMGSSTMMGKVPSEKELSEMPADGVFMMLSQTCSACHTRFRAE
ncbi:c-type cytochrome [Parasedimentitalea maritima]|uniref:Cytochrome c n=1 Tax=Parasedimentitalea maritima TaxID=2578117 RepID=A0A6A4RAI2_9RHOB|nr:cytochrome c [Zongyanglinia marina]KAE9625892.1 cytochrome c [Zongyanglinia marina]